MKIKFIHIKYKKTYRYLKKIIKINHFLWQKSVPTETVKPRVILLILIKVKIMKKEEK
jgi:hypothetical protein